MSFARSIERRKVPTPMELLLARLDDLKYRLPSKRVLLRLGGNIMISWWFLTGCGAPRNFDEMVVQPGQASTQALTNSVENTLESAFEALGGVASNLAEALAGSARLERAI